MGFGGISIWQLLIILVIVLLLFGTKRLRNLGGDLGNAVKGFRKAMDDGEKESPAEKIEQAGDLGNAVKGFKTAMGDEDKKGDAEPERLEKADETVIDGEATREKDKT